MTVSNYSCEIGILTIQCYIEYSVTTYHPASWYDPAEGGEVENEILYVDGITKNGEVVNLKDSQIKYIEAFLNETRQEEIYAACEAHCEKNWSPDEDYRD